MERDIDFGSRFMKGFEEHFKSMNINLMKVKHFGLAFYEGATRFYNRENDYYFDFIVDLGSGTESFREFIPDLTKESADGLAEFLKKKHGKIKGKFGRHRSRFIGHPNHVIPEYNYNGRFLWKRNELTGVSIMININPSELKSAESYKNLNTLLREMFVFPVNNYFEKNLVANQSREN